MLVMKKLTHKFVNLHSVKFFKLVVKKWKLFKNHSKLRFLLAKIVKVNITTNHPQKTSEHGLLYIMEDIQSFLSDLPHNSKQYSSNGFTSNNDIAKTFHSKAFNLRQIRYTYLNCYF